MLTHTLLLEKDAANVTTAILIGSGPLTNIDVTARNPANGRSQIRRLVFNPLIAIFPPPTIPWADGTVIAYGIRNPAGFAYSVAPSIDPVNTRSLLVVENGASIENVTGFTALFANDNPSDEIDLVKYTAVLPPVTPIPAPQFYGFPDCAPLWNPSADPAGDPEYVGLPRGTQFSLNLEATRNDAWCQDTSNNVPPVLDFQVTGFPSYRRVS